MAQINPPKFAPPISHDNVFFYYGGHPNFSFYVKVENRGVFHQHPRAEPSYLHSLLTHQAVAGPHQTVHNNAPSFKDETEHFYCAQLLHYGLKPLKTKAPAKKALLAAFGNGNTLLVPKHILELEQRLRQEYELANGQVGSRYTEREAEGKTQGHRGDEKIGQAFARATSSNAEPSIQDAPRQVAKKTAPNAMPRTKQTAVKSNGKKPTVSGSKKLTHADTTGSFDVHAPSLSSEWPDMCPDGFTLEMAPSTKTGRHLWASFDFGIITGVMRCSRPPTAIGETCTFTWRGEESSEGQLLYGDSQKGTITFMGAGRFNGVMEGAFFGKAQFEGRRNEDPSTNHAVDMYVKEWKSQYRSINGSAYAVAEASRWGRWVEDTSRPDRPAESDTSAAASEYSDNESQDDRRTAGYPAARTSGSKLGSTSQPTAVGRRTKQTARKSAYNPPTRRSYEDEFGDALADYEGSDFDEPAAKKSKTKQPARQTNTSRPDVESAFPLVHNDQPSMFGRRTKQTARKSGYRVPARWRDEGDGYESDDRGYEDYTDDELRTTEGIPQPQFEATAAEEPPVRARRTKLTARKSAYQVPKMRHAKLKPRDTSGSFEVQAPELSNGWSYQAVTGSVDPPPKLSLKVLPSASRLWASFDFGIVSGIMRCSATTPLVVGNACDFTWRGREGADDGGELTFGEENFGAVTFLGDGKIEGVIEGSFFGRTTFSGTRTSERTTSKVWKNYLREWKLRYRSINYTAHAITSRARWGGGSNQQSHTEGPAASDTSDDEMEVDPDYVGGIYDPPYAL